MFMRKLAILVLPLLLSACWMGPEFYQPAEATRALPAGLYKSAGSYERFNDKDDAQVTTKVRISYTANGHIRAQSQSDSNDVSEGILVPIDEAAGLYAVQIGLTQEMKWLGDPGNNSFVYGLIRIRGDRYRLSLPRCDGPRRVSPGSRVYAGGLLSGHATCSFPTRAAFEAEMEEFAKDPTNWAEYRWVKG
jgi:hypothetical protein